MARLGSNYWGRRRTMDRRFSRPGVSCVFAATLLTTLAGFSCKKVQTVPEESFTNSIGMEMIKLTTGYYVSKYETRQREFEKIMGYNTSWFRGPNRPSGCALPTKRDGS